MAPKRQLTLGTTTGSNKRLKLSTLGGNEDERSSSSGPSSSVAAKAIHRTLTEIRELPGKIATKDASAAVDADPPFQLLTEEMQLSKVRKTGPGETVVYWMRMEDMRLDDNRALSLASEHATKHKIPLIILFIISPGDYKAHDRSPRRIDFMLRNLKRLQSHLKDMNIPLHVISHTPRKTVPNITVQKALDFKATRIFANMEYEVDELRRDLAVVKLARSEELEATFTPDKFIVEPGALATKQGKPYTASRLFELVYTPWLRSWTEIIHKTPSLIEPSSVLRPNDDFVRSDPILALLFDGAIPDFIPGFECEDSAKMAELWPAGTEAARQIFERFLSTKARGDQLGDVDPLAEGAESSKKSRVTEYKEERNRCDIDSSSKMSPYLASGVISPRELIRRCYAHSNDKLTSIDVADPKTGIAAGKSLSTDKTSGISTYISELAWRDFYTHILAAFPRTSMGRPFLEKFAGTVWESDESKDQLKAWMEGRTGVPIVDAGMRQANKMGWMHNRPRMITAMFLAKDLMLDWRLGERYFMQTLIDGDLASNNGGWQWCASTGADPVPYFRIFNPYTQSEKADPTGDYIRHFVPELRNVKGKAIHNPYEKLSPVEFKKLGYPKPIVDHAEARQRALRRYKNPGEP